MTARGVSWNTLDVTMMMSCVMFALAAAEPELPKCFTRPLVVHLAIFSIKYFPISAFCEMIFHMQVHLVWVKHVEESSTFKARRCATRPKHVLSHKHVRVIVKSARH